MIKHRLELKVILLYFIIIAVIIGMYGKTFQYVYNKHEKKIMSEESIATLVTMQTAINTTIKNANDFSKLILSDDVIQSVVSTGDLFGNISNQSMLIHRIYAQSQFSDIISSVWFIDKKNQILSIGDQVDAYFSQDRLTDYSWYKSVLKKAGEYHLVVSGDGNEKKVTLIRPYKNLENFSTIGYYGVNLKIDAFRATYLNALDANSEEIVIFDDRNRIICKDGISIISQKDLKEFGEKLSSSKGGTSAQNINLENGRYLMAGIYMPNEQWKIVRILPMDLGKNNADILITNMVLMLVSGILILLGSIIISRAVTMPIQKMLFHMKRAESGEFYKILDKSFFKEFKTLYDGYNLMIEKIELLIEQTIEKQKIIRKVELKEMQEQMKPHFLYNTLDSIEALAMMGENQKVCEIVESLGDFYRKSVSRGKEMLTIEEELKIVEDYINIMKIRFSDTFVEEFHVDERCLHYLLPKLTLQPLVENVFQHGIRGKEELGHIFVGAAVEGLHLHIWVKDDGEGIPEQVVMEIQNKDCIYKGKSFGLRGTIERMNIIFGENFSYQIENGTYTEIHFYIDLNGIKEEVKDGNTESYFG